MLRSFLLHSAASVHFLQKAHGMWTDVCTRTVLYWTPWLPFTVICHVVRAQGVASTLITDLSQFCLSFPHGCMKCFEVFQMSLVGFLI